MSVKNTIQTQSSWYSMIFGGEPEPVVDSTTKKVQGKASEIFEGIKEHPLLFWPFVTMTALYFKLTITTFFILAIVGVAVYYGYKAYTEFSNEKMKAQ